MSISINSEQIIRTGMPIYTPFEMKVIDQLISAQGELQFTFNFPVRQAIVIGPTSVTPTSGVFHFSYGYTSFYDLSSGDSASHDGSTNGVGGGSVSDDSVNDENVTDDNDNDGTTQLSYTSPTQSYIQYTISKDKIQFKNSSSGNKRLGFLLILVGYDQYSNVKIVTNIENKLIVADNVLPVTRHTTSGSGSNRKDHYPTYYPRSRVRVAQIDTKLTKQSKNFYIGYPNNVSDANAGSFYDLNLDIDVKNIMSFGALTNAYHLRAYDGTYTDSIFNVAAVSDSDHYRDDEWLLKPTLKFKDIDIATGNTSGDVHTFILRPDENNHSTIRFINANTNNSRLVRSILIMFGI